MTQKHIPQAILNFLADKATQPPGSISAEDITSHLKASRPTVNRHLAKLTAAGAIIREGAGPATSYRHAAPAMEAGPKAPSGATGPSAFATTLPTGNAPSLAQEADALVLSPPALALRKQLDAPLGTRNPVSYKRTFVDSYVPNQSSLLPPGLAQSLFEQGRTQGQQPAGTYARKVLEQLLIDLSWHSSRLEGNRLSLLDTQKLFAKGRSAGDDKDSAMLLNHKDAIEFMVDAVPEYGITVPVVRNLQSLLMQGLLENPDSVGAIRKTVVNITGSVYLPTQVPALLEEMLGQIVEKARHIKNPMEAAFFLWVNIAYLQPFEDGNKRSSRLCANLPLMLTNCAPLSFLDVAPTDYAMAMLGVYEQLDTTLAVELFEWTYSRSMRKYKVILDATSAPDPFRVRFREHLGEAIRQVVAFNVPVEDAIAALALQEQDQTPFQALLREELAHLEPFNCARFRLSIGKTEEWIRNGRPLR